MQMTEMHTRLCAAEIEVAECGTAAAKATERASSQEAVVSTLQRTLRQLRVEAADRQEALQLELATTNKLVCSTQHSTLLQTRKTVALTPTCHLRGHIKAALAARALEEILIAFYGCIETR